MAWRAGEGLFKAGGPASKGLTPQAEVGSLGTGNEMCLPRVWAPQASAGHCGGRWDEAWWGFPGRPSRFMEAQRQGVSIRRGSLPELP